MAKVTKNSAQLQEEGRRIIDEIEKDYTEEQKRNPEIGFQTSKRAKEIIIEKIESSVAKRLAQQSDVIFLQEVITLNRPSIKTLESEGFDIYHYGNGNVRFSTAVALRTRKFDPIVENISIPSYSGPDEARKPIYGQEIAAVVAKIKESDIKMTFSSLHSWGFQLFKPNSSFFSRVFQLFKRAERKYSQRDINQIKYGITYTKEAFDNLKGKGLAIAAGDMNNNPQNQPAQFKLIESRGFKVLEPNDMTNINGFDRDYPLRKIDFIYVPHTSILQRVWSAVKILFVSQTVLTATPARVVEGFEYTMEGNCSDHKPVVTTITITTTPSVISRISRYLNFFN